MTIEEIRDIWDEIHVMALELKHRSSLSEYERLGDRIIDINPEVHGMLQHIEKLKEWLG
jgi:hypothetical protein